MDALALPRAALLRTVIKPSACGQGLPPSRPEKPPTDKTMREMKGRDRRRRAGFSSSMARGDELSTMVMSKQTPIIFLAAAPEHDALSDDTNATAAHYSGQPFGLLKDVLLSVLPFKAWAMYNLSRPVENNAEDHYTERQGQNPPLFRTATSVIHDDSSAAAQGDTGIQMGANADRAIVLSCTQEQNVLALQV
ncbi:hypothetical protein JOB18_040096 [Solea senegalensis]|uniref:Uncharacterized protein n=1 Tax=Solea senegalensis TaxID=28829 RepID=A0AAV6RW37_SOLSE|nr:hypothetical protein JOB18_040096 [Solea senegalensis]